MKPGFRGGDNRIWQLFPKNRGASKKPGNKKPHRKHRYFQVRHPKNNIVNLSDLNRFNNNQEINPQVLIESGLVYNGKGDIKILGNGDIKKKLTFKDVKLSESAKEKILKSGGVIN